MSNPPNTIRVVIPLTCGIRRKADGIPTEGGQQSDDCGQPMIAA
jgi:hypothetical protein